MPETQVRDHPEYTKPDVWLDDDHFVEYTTMPNESDPCGGTLWHRHPANSSGWCCGVFYWRHPSTDVISEKGLIRAKGDTWQLVQKEPLHLEPSFLCHCGHHGFIRNGQWQQA